MPSHRFQWNFTSLKGLPQNSKRQTSFCFGFFPGGDRPPPGFSWFSLRKSLQIGKMYEALTAIVLNRLLWGFVHIFLHPYLMSAASISQFDRRLVNQQRQIYDCVFRLFDSSKYLTALRSNISRCQKATTLILIPLYNPSFHLWKSSKKSLGTTVYFSWIPFKICDCNKFVSTTPVTQFLL